MASAIQPCADACPPGLQVAQASAKTLQWHSIKYARSKELLKAHHKFTVWGTTVAH